MEFTENEKTILKIMFTNYHNLLNEVEYLYMNGECFSHNDLFYLAEKLGIDFD